MIKFCGECQKAISKNDFYQVSYKCNHELDCCIDCVGHSNSVDLCFNCRLDTNCEKCHKGIDKTKTKDFKRINFQNCKLKDHSICVCKSCFQTAYFKLVESKSPLFCYMCTSNIEKNNLIYYTEPLNCAGTHKANLCGKCYPVFQKIKKRCPRCSPFDVTGELCVACYHPTNEKITILPIACDNTAHKFTICFDCVDNLTQPHMVCRLCDAKEKKNFVYLQTVENEQDEQCLSILKFALNKLDVNSIEVDGFVCPECEPVSVNLCLITNQKDDKEQEQFYPFAAVAKFGQNLMVSGGINGQLEASSNECLVVKFPQDGRHYQFNRNTYTSEMNKSRHAHGSFYYEKEKTIYAIGGAQKIRPSEIEYLDSIENFSVLDDSVNFSGVGEWQTCLFKLKRARCSFSQLRVGDCLVVFGGFSGVGKLEQSLEIIDFKNKKVTLVELAKEMNVPIYPVLLQKSETEMFVVGGFSKNECVNVSSSVVNFQTGKFSVSDFKGIEVRDKLRCIRAFDDIFLFGGNFFEKETGKNAGKFKMVRNGFVGRISGGHKGLKQEAVSSISNLMDCFGGEQFDFTVQK